MADAQLSRRGVGIPAGAAETARRAPLGVTRRTLLGAPLVPLILSGAEPGRSARSKDAAKSAVTVWDRAFARFRQADAALAAAARTEDEDLYDRLGIRLSLS